MLRYLHLRSEVETQVKQSYLKWKFLQNQVGFWKREKKLPVDVTIALKNCIISMNIMVWIENCACVCGFVQKNAKKM